MFETLKHSIFTSIGAASLTQEKIAEIVQEVAKHIPLTSDQAKEFSDEVTRRSTAARQDLEKQIDAKIDHAFIQMGLVKNELRKASETSSNTITQLIDARIEAALERLGIARSDELASLEERVSRLERRAE
jgi:polyhydroxyalkanoate synthesis regulator phasin